MATSLSALGEVFLGVMEQSLFVRVLITLGILVAGLLVARIASRAVRRYWESRHEDEEMVDRLKARKRVPDQLVQYVIIVVTLILAMIPINATVAEQLAVQTAEYIPNVITAMLVFLLGVILVRGVMTMLRGVTENLGVKRHADDIGVSPRILDAFLVGVKLLLYLIVLEVAIIQLGISAQLVQNTVAAASYGVVALIVFLAFFGFKDLIQNYAAGMYLRAADVLEPGKRVKLSDESGEVRDVSAFSTTISTDSGYFMLSPNKELMDREILFKRVKAEIDTLEDIKDYFVSSGTDSDGPAAAEIALTMFGFDVTQGDLDDAADRQDDPTALRDAVEELTNNEIRTGFVEADQVTELGDEFKVWFNNGALLIPYFDKSALFPGSDGHAYVLSAGVEGSEVLLIDPSTDSSAGGVYYVDDGDLMRAMQQLESEAAEETDAEEGAEAGEETEDDTDITGGYIVLAPRGTTAFWRIKNDLVYSSVSLYQQLSKSLEVQLGKILRSGRTRTYVIPDVVEDFTEKWREDGEPVTRMWSPERHSGADQGGANHEQENGADEDGA